MRAKIAGLGWVTPLGTGLEEVWRRVVAGDVAEIKTAVNPETGRAHPYVPVPMKMVESLGRNPRMRRSSPISYFAVAAGLAALENAGVSITPETAAKTALVFAISSGGVIYTRKFYEQIVKQGASSASPLLFPETVYNAPASHLAAHLGVDGASYTLVGDSSVGLAALKFGEQLLAAGDLDRVVVVGGEEMDWVLCEAYHDWRLTRAGPGSKSGALLAEGAARGWSWLAKAVSKSRRFIPACHSFAAARPPPPSTALMPRSWPARPWTSSSAAPTAHLSIPPSGRRSPRTAPPRSASFQNAHSAKRWGQAP